MSPLKTAAIYLFLALSGVSAEDTPVLCFSADDNTNFLNQRLVEYDAGGNAKLPDILRNQESNTLQLTWQPLPTGWRVEKEVIGKHDNRDIVRFLFIDPEIAPEFAREQPGYVLLGYQEKESDSIRPFFLMHGDQVASFETRLQSRSDRSCTMEVSRLWRGNGVSYDSYTVDFSSGAPHVREVTSGGRGMPTTTVRYDGSGKIHSRTIEHAN